MHSTRRFAIWLFAAAVLAAAVGSSVMGAGTSSTIERTLQLAEGGEISVKTVNGSIQVEVSDGNQVLVRAEKSARDAHDLEAVQIEIDTSPERIEIQARIPRSVRGASVSYRLQVPRTASVEATTVNGSVAIAGSHGENRAKSVNGKVRITGARGSVTANSVNGSVEVGWDALAGSRRNSVKTINGSIKIWMPDGAEGEFEASTVNGSIKTDLPLEVHKGRFGRRPSISDRIGAGGPEFAFSAVNGSISILQN